MGVPRLNRQAVYFLGPTKYISGTPLPHPHILCLCILSLGVSGDSDVWGAEQHMYHKIHIHIILLKGWMEGSRDGRIDGQMEGCENRSSVGGFITPMLGTRSSMGTPYPCDPGTDLLRLSLSLDDIESWPRLEPGDVLE